MRRGDIYWAVPDPSIPIVGHEQDVRRPTLIVSSDDALTVIPNVLTVIPLTSVEQPWATRVPVTGGATGLTKPTWAICEQIRTIATHRVQGQLGTADGKTLEQVERVLRYLLHL